MDIFDKVGALERVSGDLEFFSELVTMFFSSADSQLSAIETAINNGNAKETGSSAHSIKGSLGNLGAARAQNAALMLERLGNSGTTNGAVELLATLKKEIDIFREELTKESISF